jgi:hypothetical protein
MKKFDIPRRSWSEATYLKRNPDGDPFCIKKVETPEDLKLFHLGIALYLGEGDKKTKNVVRLGNTDVKILKIFLLFLKDICGAKREKIKAELNIFDDVDLDSAIHFWTRNLKLDKQQIRTLFIRKAKDRKQGTHKRISKRGTLTILVDNGKLKRIIMKWCSELLSYYDNLPG